MSHDAAYYDVLCGAGQGGGVYAALYRAEAVSRDAARVGGVALIFDINIAADGEPPHRAAADGAEEPHLVGFIYPIAFDCMARAVEGAGVSASVIVADRFPHCRGPVRLCEVDVGGEARVGGERYGTAADVIDSYVKFKKVFRCGDDVTAVAVPLQIGVCRSGGGEDEEGQNKEQQPRSAA